MYRPSEYRLIIANKNYSSWSLRAWLLLRALGIPFEETLIAFADGPGGNPLLAVSPTGKVPCLIDGDTLVWDSLSIAEYLAERHPAVWPFDAKARAFARSAAAEMHSGFTALRNHCSMNCGLTIRLPSVPATVTADLDRLSALWTEGLDRFGGPFLAGSTFTAADAFYAPVAFRVRTYGLPLPPKAAAYVATLLALPAMHEWDEAAIAEPFREASHEADAQAAGEWLEDRRVTA